MTEQTDFRFYYYDPSLVAGFIAYSFYFTFTTIHTWQLWSTRTWFMIPFLIEAYMESIGYTIRVVSAAENPKYGIAAYVVSIIFIFLAPTMFAATIYMELERIIKLTGGAYHSIILPSRLTIIFVVGDFMTLNIQSAGSGLTNAGISAGSPIVILGLVVQILSFCLFILTAVIFHIRLRRLTSNNLVQNPGLPWLRHLVILYICSALILVRSLIRLAEYMQGTRGYVATHEWCLYCLDFLPMFCVVVAMFLVHPSKINALQYGGKLVKIFKLKQTEQLDFELIG